MVTNFRPETYSDLQKLLWQHNLKLDVGGKFKCVHCTNILLNAYQVPCGCRLCLICVNELLDDGYKYCPSIWKNCRNQPLTEAVVDYRMNIKISKLEVKCPVGVCSWTGGISTVGKHVLSCISETVQCATENINEYLAIGSVNNNKSMIESMTLLRSQLEEVRKRSEEMEINMSTSKENAKIKDKQIEMMNDAISTLKVENENLIRNLESKFQHEDHRFDTTMKTLDDLDRDKCTTINSTQYEREELIQQIEILNQNIENKTEERALAIEKQMQQLRKVRIGVTLHLLTRIYQDHKDSIDRAIDSMDTMNKKFQLDMKIEIDNVEKRCKRSIDGFFEWVVNKVSEIGERYKDWMYSEYFYDKTFCYKMQLGIRKCSDGSDLRIWLRLHYCDNRRDLLITGPIVMHIIITIINKASPCPVKTMVKHCQIDQPLADSYQCSDEFVLSQNDGLLQWSPFVIECIVNFK